MGAATALLQPHHIVGARLPRQRHCRANGIDVQYVIAQYTILQEGWLTIVIDELSAILAKAPEVRALVQELWTLGASARIRVIVLSPEENVKAWGIEGRADIRDNLVFIRLDERR